MRYKNYSLEEKIKLIDQYRKVGSVAEAARIVGVKKDAAYHWVKNKQRLLKEYEQSFEPFDPRKSKIYYELPLEFKIKCIRAVEEGLSFRQVARNFNTAKSNIFDWYSTKDELLALYYTQQRDKREVEVLIPPINLPMELGMDDGDRDKKDLNKTIKSQSQEIEYLKDKIAFLENLNEILKERTSGVKKKKHLKQSKEVLKRGEQT